MDLKNVHFYSSTGFLSFCQLVAFFSEFFSPAGIGGAIYSFLSTMTLQGTSFTNCRAYDHGGAIMSESQSSFFISTTNFTNCQAAFQGGAILTSESSLDIRNSVFVQNNASNGGGGAIQATTDVESTITDTEFRENFGNQGGAIFLQTRVSMAISSSTIKNNFAKQDGGGIYCSNSQLTINKTIFSHNQGETNGTFFDSDFVCASVPSGTFCDLKSDNQIHCPKPKHPSQNNGNQTLIQTLAIIFASIGAALCVLSLCAYWIIRKRKDQQSQELFATFENGTFFKISSKKLMISLDLFYNRRNS